MLQVNSHHPEVPKRARTRDDPGSSPSSALAHSRRVASAQASTVRDCWTGRGPPPYHPCPDTPPPPPPPSPARGRGSGTGGTGARGTSILSRTRTRTRPATAPSPQRGSDLTSTTRPLSWKPPLLLPLLLLPKPRSRACRRPAELFRNPSPAGTREALRRRAVGQCPAPRLDTARRNSSLGNLATVSRKRVATAERRRKPVLKMTEAEEEEEEEEEEENLQESAAKTPRQKRAHLQAIFSQDTSPPAPDQPHQPTPRTARQRQVRPPRFHPVALLLLLFPLSRAHRTLV